MISGTSPGGPQILRTCPVEGKLLVQGSSKQLPNTRLLTCKQLKADTRLANWQLQTAGLEKTGKLDCQLVIERTGGTFDCQFAKYSSQPGGPLKGARIYVACLFSLTDI